MHSRLLPPLLLILSLPLPACDDAAGTEPVASEDALGSFYRQMQQDALGFPPEDGQWPDHYGDAPFYGLAFYVRAGETEDDDRYRAFAAEARTFALGLVTQANGDFLWFAEHMEDVIMAALGLIEYADQHDDVSFRDDLDALLDTANGLVEAAGWYLPLESSGKYGSTYGPTTMTAALALLNLQYAVYLGGARRADRVQAAGSLLEGVRSKAFDGERYLFAPDEERLHLYSNVMTLLALGRMHEATGDPKHLDAAREAYAAIQPLKDDEKGSYHSPYSAEYMGATSDDYQTLSSQNYTAMALLVLHERTGEAVYLDEAKAVLDFSRSWLYDSDQGKLLHHWMDGRIALPDDPEYFCSGCNLQYLYVVWYLRERATTGGASR